jgi:hypothetical protein
METIYFTENMWQFKVLQWLTPRGASSAKCPNKLIWGRALEGVMNDKAKAATRYNAYIEEVKAAVPPGLSEPIASASRSRRIFRAPSGGRSPMLRLSSMW